MSDGYAPKKEMPIPLAVPLAFGAASLFSSVFGGISSRNAAKRAARQLAEEKAATEAERRRKKYETWTSTASGQNTIRMLQDQADREWKRVSGAAAVGGASEDAVNAVKEQNNIKQAEVIAQANANFEDKKDQVDASYRQQLSSLTQQQIAANQQKADAIAQVAGGVGNALMQAGMATFGGTKLGQQLMGAGSPAGSGVTPGTQTAPTQLQQMGSNYRMLNPSLQRYMLDFGNV